MKIACVQMDVFLGKPEANLSKISRYLRTLKTQSTDLAVFPEACLTGYVVGNPEQARAIALENNDTHPIRSLQKLCEELDMCVIVGYAERIGEKLYNSVAFIEPFSPPRVYRKTHLPFLGYDRFATAGDELVVWDTRLGKIGPLICFDLRIPEAARTLALKGAELILLPTNWPIGAEVSAEHIAITRAAENHVFLATCNRVGTEGDVRFIGKSKIIHASGRVLAAAEAFEIVLLAELDLAEARVKKQVFVPGEYEIETFQARRVDLYS